MVNNLKLFETQTQFPLTNLCYTAKRHNDQVHRAAAQHRGYDKHCASAAPVQRLVGRQAVAVYTEFYLSIFENLTLLSVQ
jgi:hypothetical protein